jgi:hypothetical protein
MADAAGNDVLRKAIAAAGPLELEDVRVGCRSSFC